MVDHLLYYIRYWHLFVNNPCAGNPITSRSERYYNFYCFLVGPNYNIPNSPCPAVRCFIYLYRKFDERTFVGTYSSWMWITWDNPDRQGRFVTSLRCLWIMRWIWVWDQCPKRVIDNVSCRPYKSIIFILYE